MTNSLIHKEQLKTRQMVEKTAADIFALFKLKADLADSSGSIRERREVADSASVAHAALSSLFSQLHCAERSAEMENIIAEMEDAVFPSRAKTMYGSDAPSFSDVQRGCRALRSALQI